MRFNRPPSKMQVLASAFGVTGAVAGLWSASIEIQPVTDVFGSGYVAGADEVFAAVARQSRLNAIAALFAACSAVTAAFARST